MSNRGRSNQLTKQTGEYLVATELCRKGLITTTFTGNVPDFDLVATTKDLRVVPIQVKAKNGPKGDWPGNAKNFLDISWSNDIQTVKGKFRIKNPDLIYVYVNLIEPGRDEFYICRKRDIQNITYKKYTGWLNKKKGRRPKNPESTDCRITAKDLEPYRDKWEIIYEAAH